MVDLDEDTLASAGPEAIWGNVEPISEASDLPTPQNGVHDLSERDNRAYLLTENVVSDAALKLGAMTPVVGWHGGISTFTHTGSGAAIRARDAPVFLDSIGVFANTKLFSLRANTSTEHLVNECAFYGGNWGLVKGYNVPAFKTCSFSNPTAGLRFEGSPDKVLIKDCPLRNVTTGGVTLLTFAGDLDANVLTVNGAFVQNIQSDTEVVRVESGGLPALTFDYTGNTHFGSVTESNILTGDAAVEAVGVNVTDSAPLRDSGSGIEYEFTSPPNTTTISSAGTPVKVEGATTVQNSERFDQPTHNEARYIGRSDTEKEVAARLSVSATSTTGRAYIAINGSVQGNGAAFETQGSNSPIPVTVAKRLFLNENDSISVYIENTDGTGNIDVDSLSFIA